MRHQAFLAVALAGVLLLTCTEADAIPAFARRYQTSCLTCHVAIPKLNAFGIAFRNNGYRMPPGDEAYVRVPDVSLGAPGWKRLWPDAVWPGAISGIPPVAFRLISDVVVDPRRLARVDFEFPHEFEVLAGGTAGERLSYFAELEVEGSGEVVLARAFAQFDHLGGTTMANLVIGRFEPRVVPFSRIWRRLTSSDFLTSEYRSVTDGFDFKQSQAGFEFWGARSGRGGRGGVEYAVGLVNGNGPGTDNNTSKDFYYRASRKFGGFGVTGSSGNAPIEPEVRSWRDDSVRLGTFGYLGHGLFNTVDDKFWRAGADIDVFWRDLNLFAAAWRGRDRTDLQADGRLSTALSVEANYMVKPWIVTIIRYDSVVRNEPAIQRLVPALVLTVRANVRIVAESVRSLERGDDSRARVRLDLLF